MTPPTFNAIIKLKSKDLEFITFLLHEYQIDHEVPNNFKLVEKYDSKI